MKKIVAVVLASLFCTICCFPVSAMEDETEMTGGFKPIGMDSLAPDASDASAPEPQPETDFAISILDDSPGNNETELSLEPEDNAGDADLIPEYETAYEPQELPEQFERNEQPEQTESPETQFADAAMISETYQHAVASMAEDGILIGFEDGSFRPTNTLTREQGTKIIAYLLLGAEGAETLSCDKNPYTDVWIYRWSAPVIVWCTEQHILHGMGDGTFRPDDILTGAQFAKMLLCAFKLGDPERYVGNDWLVHVLEDGDQIGLFVGDDGMKNNVPLQRQQAALLAENAIKAARP